MFLVRGISCRTQPARRNRKIEKRLSFPLYNIGFSDALYYFQAYALSCLSCLNIFVLNLHRFDDLLEVRRRSLYDYCVTDFQWSLQFDHGNVYFREEMSYAADFNHIFFAQTPIPHIKIAV